MITFNCPKAILPLSLFLILSDDKGLNNDNLILMGMQSDVGQRYQENGLASFFRYKFVEPASVSIKWYIASIVPERSSCLI